LVPRLKRWENGREGGLGGCHIAGRPTESAKTTYFLQTCLVLNVFLINNLIVGHLAEMHGRH
jgi:hypothetical protein